MPQTFPEVDEWVSQTAPAAGEPRTVESVADPFRRAARRTTALKTRMDYLDPNKNGVRRIRTRGFLEALADLTEHAHGEVCFVPGYGLYFFQGSESGPDSELPPPMYVRPTNVAEGEPGRWESQYVWISQEAQGLARVGADGKLVSEQNPLLEDGRVPARLVQNGFIVDRAFPTPQIDIVGSAFVDLPQLQFNFSNPVLSPTDRMIVHVVLPPMLAKKGSLRLDVTRDGAHGYGTEFKFEENTTATLACSFSVGSGASRTLQVQGRSEPNNSSVFEAGGLFRVQVQRP